MEWDNPSFRMLPKDVQEEMQKEYQYFMEMASENRREIFETMPDGFKLPHYVETVCNGFDLDHIPSFITIEGYDAVLWGATKPKVRLEEKKVGKYKLTCIEVILTYKL